MHQVLWPIYDMGEWLLYDINTKAVENYINMILISIKLCINKYIEKEWKNTHPKYNRSIISDMAQAELSLYFEMS